MVFYNLPQNLPPTLFQIKIFENIAFGHVTKIPTKNSCLRFQNSLGNHSTNRVLGTA